MTAAIIVVVLGVFAAAVIHYLLSNSVDEWRNDEEAED